MGVRSSTAQEPLRPTQEAAAAFKHDRLGRLQESHTDGVKAGAPAQHPAVFAGKPRTGPWWGCSVWPLQQGGGQDSPVGVRPHFFQPRDLASEDLLRIGDIEEIELAVHRQRGLLPGVKGLGTIP